MELEKSVIIFQGTSEDKHDIREQPENSCPTIDTAIEQINLAQKAQRHAHDYAHNIDDEDSQKQYVIEELDRIYSELFDLENNFEYCRSQCEDIREWGQQWKDLALQLIQEKESSDAT